MRKKSSNTIGLSGLSRSAHIPWPSHSLLTPSQALPPRGILVRFGIAFSDSREERTDDSGQVAQRQVGEGQLGRRPPRLQASGFDARYGSREPAMGVWAHLELIN